MGGDKGEIEDRGTSIRFWQNGRGRVNCYHDNRVLFFSTAINPPCLLLFYLKRNGPIILTGFSALNKLLGREVYTSQDQLGGPQVRVPVVLPFYVQ